MAMSSVVQMWGEWQLRVLVLSSLSLQFSLFIASALRKYPIPSWFRLGIWLAFLGSDALAIYALATLFNRHRNQDCSSHSILEVMWAPTLLIHLGGQDPITAYNIEDNELWTRHILTLLSQVAVAVYVFSTSWTGISTRLFSASVLLFIAGVLKFSEKPWALKKASINSLASSSIVVKKISASGEGSLSLSFEKYVEEARKCVEATKIAQDQDEALRSAIPNLQLEPYELFVDLAAPYSYRLRSLRSFLMLDDKRAYKVLQAAFSNTFDLLYTKEKALQSLYGGCVRELVLALTVAAVVLFATSYKIGYNKDDVVVTYILFAGTAGLEFLVFWRFIVISDDDNTRLLRITEDTYIPYGHILVPERQPTSWHELWHFFISVLLETWRFIQHSWQSALDSWREEWRSALESWRESRSAWRERWRSALDSWRERGPSATATWLVREVLSTLKEFLFSRATWRKLLLINAQRSIATSIVMLLRRPTWLNKVAQYSLIEFFARHKKHAKRLTIARLFRCKDYLDRYYVVHQNSSKSITMLVLQYVKEGWRYIHDLATYRRFTDRRGQWTLRFNECYGQLGWSIEVPFDESILLWHIATDLCFHYRGVHRDRCATLCTEMSNYMIYLLFICPEMLMAGTRKNLFTMAYDELEDIFKAVNPPLDKRELTQRILHEVSSSQYATRGLIYNSCKLAKELLKLNDLQMWKVIAGVWVEMLCYSAGKCRGYLHAKSLGMGGEYISYVWLLLSQMGMETLADRLQMPMPLEEEETIGASISGGRISRNEIQDVRVTRDEITPV